MDDLQQLTTLQYCLIDNCTIMRIDTGQQLDIVYTTQSLLVVTPTDGQTSIIISKSEPELFCSTPNTTEDSNIARIPLIIISLIVVLVSGYIIAVHIIFKELRTTFGKLMTLYNVAVVCGCVNIIALDITHYDIAAHSTVPCYLFHFLFMQFGVIFEAFATTFIAYLAYIMHRNCKYREMTKEINKQFYKHSILCVLGLSLLFDIFVVGYDFGTGTYKHTLLPNGHCSFLEYDTLGIYHTCIKIAETIQVLLLVTFFVYYYKLRKMLTLVRKLANNTTRRSQMFLKIGITMAVTIGLSKTTIALSWYLDNEILLRVGASFFFIQQCVLMSFYMCKMSQLCKERFCTTETSP